MSINRAGSEAKEGGGGGRGKGLRRGGGGEGRKSGGRAPPLWRGRPSVRPSVEGV